MSGSNWGLLATSLLSKGGGGNDGRSSAVFDLGPTGWLVIHAGTGRPLPRPFAAARLIPDIGRGRALPRIIGGFLAGRSGGGSPLGRIIALLDWDVLRAASTESPPAEVAA